VMHNCITVKKSDQCTIDISLDLSWPSLDMVTAEISIVMTAVLFLDCTSKPRFHCL
jgi:hypothetical protein